MNGTTGMADEPATFESVVLPHLDAAHRLARRLVANEHDAEDVVQEACVRALQYFRTFSGGNSRAWFLRIVRNTCSSWNRHAWQLATDVFDEEQHSTTTLTIDSVPALQVVNALSIEHAIRGVPARFRELIVLRELKGLSYRETADALGIPIGSVMSGLFRARQALRWSAGQPPAIMRAAIHK